MAAPTSVSVEAIGTTTTVLRWTYAGAASVTVYRSTDGVSYAAVSGAVLPPTTVSYTDDTLSAATKYWYKLTDDAGLTFSSIVTVWTHVCPGNQDGSAVFALPRFAGEADPQELSAQLDDMAQRIEEVVGTRTMEPAQCIKCPVDGALVLDCSGGCNDFIVVADQDINSISINWCDNGSGGGSGTGGQVGVNFVVPPNSSVNICGWPAGTGFSGGECSGSPIITGDRPKQKKVELTCKCMDLAQGAIGFTPGYPCACVEAKSNNIKAPQGACGCTSATGALTIKSCTAGNSLGCSGAKSLTVAACGGMGPYTWSKTGTVNLSSTTGNRTTVTPPTNSGSGVAGTAYAKRHYICVSGACSGVTCTNVQAESEIPYTCNDVAGACQAVSGGAVPSGAAVGAVCCPQVGEERCPSGTCPSFGAGVNVVDDLRTAPMIAAGCTPCGLNAGNTVSVTDALGTVATIILTA